MEDKNSIFVFKSNILNHLNLLYWGPCSLRALVLMFQPFRGNPNYDTVANLPYDSKCLAQLTQGQEEINIKSIARCRMETMYDTVCMNNKVGSIMMYYILYHFQYYIIQHSWSW